MKTPNVLFTIYDPVTGRVLRTGSVTPIDEDLQVREGEAVLKGVRAEPDEEVAFVEEEKDVGTVETKESEEATEPTLVPILTKRADLDGDSKTAL
jgi:hypothetical protein